MDDNDRTVRRPDAASLLSGESLDSLSRDELAARIVLLETEIERVRAHQGRTDAHRLAAEALFAKRAP